MFQVEAAHLCYLVASYMPQPFDAPDSRLCLLGADHKAHTRQLAGLLALQRTELYEYVRMLAGRTRCSAAYMHSMKGVSTMNSIGQQSW